MDERNTKSRQYDSLSRRNLLRNGAVFGTTALGISVGGVTASSGSSEESGNAAEFGRVYANGTLWRTKVVRTLDERPDPEDKIYFLHDGSSPIVANGDASADQQSPFVSESAPGDRDWNGGKWTHVSAEVTDVEAFNENAPLTSAADVLGEEYIDVTLGRPGFGPPNYFICPLNGRA